MKIALAAVVLGLALAAAGCGGDDSESSATPTEEWAEGYCAAIVDWATELRQSTDVLRDYRSLSQDAFDQAGADIRSATEDFAAELRALGAPDTESGEEARQAVQTFATATETDVDEIEQAVDGVSDASDISKAVVSITATLTSMNKAFTTMVNSLRKAGKELQTALENAESCDDLNG